LISPQVVIYVHDFQRPLEKGLTRQFFGSFFRRERQDDTAMLEVIGVDVYSKLLAKVTITLGAATEPAWGDQWDRPEQGLR
jgi:hypothetical protein